MSLQADGDLVEYNAAGNMIWHSGTAGNPGAELRLQNNGNLAIVNKSGTVVWETKTGT